MVMSNSLALWLVNNLFSISGKTCEIDDKINHIFNTCLNDKVTDRNQEILIILTSYRPMLINGRI